MTEERKIDEMVESENRSERRRVKKKGGSCCVRSGRETVSSGRCGVTEKG